MNLEFLEPAIATKKAHGGAVATLEELDSLDENELLAGYSAPADEVPIGKSKAYVHGWLNRQVDRGLLPISEAQRQLARLAAARGRL
jgi:hypothetical protein